MSLIGNLEDLGLGDILQIINLSQKSGVLSIRGEGGEGRIVFQDGMVRYAGLDEGPTDLHELLVKRGFVSEEDFQTARSQVDQSGSTIDEALASTSAIDAERIESLRRETAETAVAEMFSWKAGDFSFDVGDDERWIASELALSAGVNAQYLAMESMRVKDEDDRGRDCAEAGSAESPDSGLNLDLSAAEMFGVVDESSPAKDDFEPEQVGDAPEPFEEISAPIFTTEQIDSSTGSELLEGEIVLEEEGHDAHVLELDELEAEGGSALAPELLLDDTEFDDALSLEDDTASFSSPPVEAGPNFEGPVDSLDAPEAGEIEALGEALALEMPIDEPAAPILDAPLEDMEHIEGLEPVRAEELEAERSTTPHPANSPTTATTPAMGSTPAAPSASVTAGEIPPVVVIAPSLVVLEWVRRTLSEEFAQVHIFQRSQEGLGRIRQYLSRARTPILLVSPEIDGNPLSGISDSGDFVARLKKQAPRMLIHWLTDETGAAEVEQCGLPALPVSLCPSIAELETDPDVAHPEIESQLRESIAGSFGAACEARPPRQSPSAEARPVAPVSTDASEGLDRLKTATQALSDASTRGEVLPLVMRFAAESFSRVAMFMVRGDSVVGMAQLGLEAGGGPDDIEMRAMVLERDEVSWFRDVIRSRAALRRGVVEDGDRKLIALLGGTVPDGVYVAPIVSADQVVALLYADGDAGLPESGDTSALEVVLHHAGLALDRAMLERTLAQIEDESQ